MRPKSWSPARTASGNGCQWEVNVQHGGVGTLDEHGLALGDIIVDVGHRLNMVFHQKVIIKT